MKKLTIGIDMDEIICDCHGRLIKLYNRDYPNFPRLRRKDIIQWEVGDNVLIGDTIRDYLHRPGFYLKLKPLPGAIENIRRLIQAGHEIIILTANSMYPGSAAEKLWWISKYLPELKRSVVITKRKELVKVDVFIDDAPKNLIAYKRAWPDSKVVTIAYEHNIDLPEVDWKAFDYTNIEAAWSDIYDFIMSLS